MKAIIITGALATGKSTFATILSKKYHILLLTKDRIKEILGDDIGFTNREENLKLSKATIDIMFNALNNAIESNTNIILEANFHQEEIDYLKTLKSDYLILNLFGSDEILYHRFKNRILNENRHKVHTSAGLLDYHAFCDYIKKSNYIDFGQLNSIEICADNFLYQNNEDLFIQIENFLKKD